MNVYSKISLLSRFLAGAECLLKNAVILCLRRVRMEDDQIAGMTNGKS